MNPDHEYARRMLSDVFADAYLLWAHKNMLPSPREAIIEVTGHKGAVLREESLNYWSSFERQCFENKMFPDPVMGFNLILGELGWSKASRSDA